MWKKFLEGGKPLRFQGKSLDMGVKVWREGKVTAESFNGGAGREEWAATGGLSS